MQRFRSTQRGLWWRPVAEGQGVSKQIPHRAARLSRQARETMPLLCHWPQEGLVLRLWRHRALLCQSDDTSVGTEEWPHVTCEQGQTKTSIMQNLDKKQHDYLLITTTLASAAPM